ncbi:hypothetical protein, partial [Longimicrobium sp.]|uniref:hypothetical protein n=1 Tax=Longimicrobium sp. TaxID=2029185 RepID=UPI002E2FB570
PGGSGGIGWKAGTAAAVYAAAAPTRSALRPVRSPTARRHRGRAVVHQRRTARTAAYASR